MRKLAVVLILACLPICAQNNRLSRLKNRHALPAAGLVAFYRLGGLDAGVQTTGARWTERKRNLANWSEDLTSAIYWPIEGGTLKTATTVTFTAQYDGLYQAVATLNAQTYTFSFKARTITGNVNLTIAHASSASGNTQAKTITSTLTRYSFTVLGKSGGGLVTFGIYDFNASGFGQIEFTEIQVSPGSTLLPYEKTEANQRAWDYSGNANHATRGSTSGADTNDPSFNVATAAIRGMSFDATNDQISSMPALGGTYTVINMNATQVEGVDSGGGKYIAGVSNGAAVIYDIGTVGGYTNAVCGLRAQYNRVLSAAEQARVNRVVTRSLP